MQNLNRCQFYAIQTLLNFNQPLNQEDQLFSFEKGKKSDV